MTKQLVAMTGMLLSLAFGGAASADEKPAVSRSVVLKLELAGPVDAAFTLFNPINESRWSPDWNPHFLTAPRIAAGVVFVTTALGEGSTVWLLDRYDATAHTLRYVAYRAGRTLTQLDITVRALGADSSEAIVQHVQTALDGTADNDVRELAHDFPNQRSHWEAALNAVLHRQR